MGPGTVEITGIKRTFHSATSGRNTKQTKQ
jgi:hypothetical protein